MSRASPAGEQAARFSRMKCVKRIAPMKCGGAKIDPDKRVASRSTQSIREDRSMRHFLRRVSALVSAASLCIAGAAFAEDPLRIGVITFLSGPAAGPFGVPAKNASDLVAEALNKGGQIPGYEKKGFGGRAIELVYVDEAGGPSKVVTEYRNLVDR